MIKIDRYEPTLENGRVIIYAIKGKEKYPIPECYKEMCNDGYLAIEQVTRALPELYETTPVHYVPLRTRD